MKIVKDHLFLIKKAFKQIFFYPVSDIQKVDTDYNAYWRDKRGENIGKISRWQRQRAEIVLEYIKKRESISIIDIGCGDGVVLKYIKERVSVSGAIGVDVSNFALDRAKDFGIETILADMQDLHSVPDLPKTDYVLMFEILEHVHDSESFLTYLLGKAEKGVFFSFPNTGFLIHRLRLLFGKFPLQWRLHPREHVRFWTHADLKWWLKALGYKDYKIHTYEGVPIFNKIWPSLFAAAFVVYLEKER